MPKIALEFTTELGGAFTTHLVGRDVSFHITDQMIMPDLTGDEFVKELRYIQPDMPIILCTGYSTQMDENKANSLGVNIHR